MKPLAPANPASELRSIRIRGAREHNLKGVDLAIPRDCLIVMTGVSGSGKSSLAFDTIFAEGQRKYMESLSAYARQFLDQMQKPDVESIEGLPPTIAIEQRGGGHTPRSTVATTTEIYDYLRLLFARCGTPTCWHADDTGHICGKPIRATAPTQIVDALLSHDGARMMICAPVVRRKKGFHKEILEALAKQGLMRARVNGSVVDIRETLKSGGENPLGLGRYEAHDIEAVIDRIVASQEDRQRIAESVETALKLGEGNVLVLTEESGGSWKEHRYSEKFSCPEHPECALEELEPRLFSFNSPQGACPACAGLGHVQEFDEALVVPDPTKPFSESIEPWRRNGPRMNSFYARAVRNFGAFFKIKPSVPFDALPAKIRNYLMNGIPESERDALGGKFEGVLPNLKRRFQESESEFVKERLLAYMSAAPCPGCQGKRLRAAALAVKMHSGSLDVSIADTTALSIERAIGLFTSLKLSKMQASIAEPILKEIDARLGFLGSVGLGYLTLDRASGTLSGGEAQRIRLATQVGSGLVGVAYVLDEPTIGLHQRDNDRLLATLRRLADIGNTVIVVEHDEDVIRAADHLVDVGPGPGRHGGKIVAAGSIDEVMACEESLTGAYLSGRRAIVVPQTRRPVRADRAIMVKGARENNLKGIDVAFPLGGLICVTGVSGSGKSTLVSDILLKAVQKHVHGTRVVPGAHTRITGITGIERVVEVDQSPIGRTPRSNPATYTGIFDEIRKHFAKAPEAKIRGYEPGRFSFNVKGGRCEACQGQGMVKIEMHFLPDVFVACETCKGTRYNRETLEIRFKGKNIAEVLEMTVDDALLHFEAHPKVRGMLECLRDVGLGYIQLGQASTTVSGGEAQRIKLATELGNMSSASTLYVLDEPTTGLHFADVERLLGVLQRLADSGHTLVIIEHNLDVVKCADWLIDLGPDGGERGGTVIACGTPKEVAGNPASHTGRYLKPILERAQSLRPQSATKPARRTPANSETVSTKLATGPTKKKSGKSAEKPAKKSGKTPAKQAVKR